MIQTREARRAGGAAGLEDLSFRSRIDSHLNKSRPPISQAENVIDASRRFRHATTPVPRIEVRISVSDGGAPIGRSRRFRLQHCDVDERISRAGRLEARI